MFAHVESFPYPCRAHHQATLLRVEPQGGPSSRSTQNFPMEMERLIASPLSLQTCDSWSFTTFSSVFPASYFQALNRAIQPPPSGFLTGIALIIWFLYLILSISSAIKSPPPCPGTLFATRVRARSLYKVAAGQKPSLPRCDLPPLIHTTFGVRVW